MMTKSGDSSDKLDFSLILASSVHDMKNSIGMLLNSINELAEHNPAQNSTQAKRFNTLQYEASRINNELVQLLSLYRLGENRLPLRIDQHYIIDILEDQLARSHELIEHNNFDLRFKCDPDLEWYLDADLVGSVIHNVLLNCCRYTHKKLLLCAEEQNNTLCFTIADDGQGYPQVMIEQPTVNTSEACISEGKTHLGLYFAERIAHMHQQDGRQGYIVLQNGLPLGGGVFKLYLP